MNYEQSPKPKPPGTLWQPAIDRAFRSQQRQSTFAFRYAVHRIVVLSGKNTQGLEVVDRALPHGPVVRVTNLERTLIDSVVRPACAGGVAQVLAAFRVARQRTTAEKLIAVLRALDYAYPYHQAVGFYMERAGFPFRQLSSIRKLGIDFDFYLAHGMKDAAYDARWQIHYPPDLIKRAAERRPPATAPDRLTSSAQEPPLLCH